MDRERPAASGIMSKNSARNKSCASGLCGCGAAGARAPPQHRRAASPRKHAHCGTPHAQPLAPCAARPLLDYLFAMSPRLATHF